MDTVSADKKYLWHPFTGMADWVEGEPLVIDRGEGAYLYDTEGNRYLDAVSSLWANLHGHRHPIIDAAVRRQLERVAHTTLLGLTHAPAAELARRLIGIVPAGLARVFYSGDGASAVEAALKISYQYWWHKGGEYRDKRRFMSFTDGYHGDTLGAVGVGGIDLFHRAYRDLISPSIQLPYANCYRCRMELSYPSCNLQCAAELEPYFLNHSGEAAAVIIEPKVQGAAGMIVAADGFLKAVRDLCTRYNVHLIADEVATGFGRTGTMFACEHDGVSPDLMCLGKGLTGGYMALSATLTTEEIFEGFLDWGSSGGTFYHGHTYSGNPLACAAGIASLDVFEREEVLAKLQGKIAHLAGRLASLGELSAVGHVRQAGFMVGVELVADKEARTPFPESAKMGARVTAAMRRRGVISRPLGDVLTLVPPLAVEKADLDLAVDAMRDSIIEVAREAPAT